GCRHGRGRVPGPSQRDVRGRGRGRPQAHRLRRRPHAALLHPHHARRPHPRRALALRPHARPDRLPLPRLTLMALLDSLEAARVFDLEQLRYAGAPSHPAHAPGFNYFLHRHHPRGAEPRARVEIRAGDVVRVRAGYGGLWSKADEYLKAAGVSAAGARWLIEKKVFAVGADNMAFDVMGPRDPELDATLPAHVLL